MKSRARFSSVRVSGSDFVKTFKSRSRIFKQGSRRLGESRIIPFATPKCSLCYVWATNYLPLKTSNLQQLGRLISNMSIIGLGMPGCGKCHFSA